MSGARDQVSRLLALVPYLQARGEVPVAEAARTFGVTPRTIRRDLNVLLFCGLPGLGMGDLIDVDFDALEGEGVIRLSNADYLTRPLRLDSTEAAALVVALRTLREAGSDAERAIVDRALTKLEAAAGDAAELAAHVDVRLPAAAREQLRLRAELDDAVARRRQVRLRYHSPARDALTDRVVDPIAVVTAQDHTYLDAWCHLVEDRRLFRLDRVASAEVLGTPAQRHPDLAPRDLAEGLFTPSEDDLTATLALTREARWVAEYYPVEDVAEDGAGGLVVRLRVGDPGWLVRLLLRLGPTARLREPAELADEARAAARRALSHYPEDVRTMATSANDVR